MEENWNAENQPRTYGEESQMYENGQPNYGQQSQPNYGQPNYNQPYNGGYYGAPQPQHGKVTDVFCYILLAIMPLRIILGWVGTANTFSMMNYENIMNGNYVAAGAAATGSVMLLSLFSMLLNIVFLVCIIVDIVMVHKQGYKITGLILFAIFLNPGYYIWRAHVLKRKMAFPIVYTVAYSLLTIAYWIYTFYASFQMVFGMVEMMP